MEQQHRAPILHVQRENLWRLREILGLRRVKTQVLGQVDVPSVQQLFKAHEFGLAEAVRPYGIDGLHDHAKNDGCKFLGSAGADFLLADDVQSFADSLKHEMAWIVTGVVRGTWLSDTSPTNTGDGCGIHPSVSSG